MLEKLIIQMLLDKEIRYKVKPYLHPAMFSRKCYAGTCAFILKSENIDYDLDYVLLIDFLLKNQDETKADYIENEYDVEDLKGMFLHPAKIADQKLAIHSIAEFIRDYKIARAMERVIAKKSKNYNEVIEAAGFTITSEEYINLADRDNRKKIMEEDFVNPDKIVKSSFSLINTYTQYKGYKPGDILVVAATSGLGKSTFLCTEGAHFIRNGKKVYHLILGDMSRTDCIIKYTANLTKTHVDKITENFLLYSDKIEEELNHLYIPRDVSVGTQKVDEIISNAKGVKQQFDFDIMIIDYDGNIAPEFQDMYQNGGAIYNKLKSFATKENIIILTASQIKSEYQDKELIPMNAINESSKKQHPMDFILGLGRNDKCKKVGTLNLAKVRRGRNDIQMRVLFNNGYGSIKEITQQEYDNYLAQPPSYENESNLAELNKLMLNVGESA